MGALPTGSWDDTAVNVTGEVRKSLPDLADLVDDLRADCADVTILLRHYYLEQHGEKASVPGWDSTAKKPVSRRRALEIGERARKDRSMRRSMRTIGLVALLCAATGGTAQAGALSRPANDTLLFSGDSRADDVTVTYDATGSAVTFSDPAIAIGVPSTVATALDCEFVDKTHLQVVCRALGLARNLEVSLKAGNDRVRVTGGSKDSSPPAERLRGDEGNDTLAGGPGPTSFNQEPGADRMTGGAGRDGVSYAGSAAGVTVTVDGLANDGGENDNVGTDVEIVVGSDHDDRLIAGPSGTKLAGLNGDDILTGGAGPDELSPGAGIDSMTGGAGIDQVDYCCGPFAVSLDGLANDGLISTDQFDLVGTDIENIHTEGPGQSFVFGSPGPNRFTVEGGNRAFASGLGGDDTFIGDFSADSFSGGPGFDTITYGDRSLQFHTAPVRVTLDDLANDGRDGELDNVGSDVEHVIGSPGGDNLTGSANGDTFEGGGGNDTIDGLAGADQLHGDDGDDLIRARDPLPTAFPDEVSCGAGADIITVDLQDQFTADCEDVAQAAIDQGPGLQISRKPLRVDRARLTTLRLSCPRLETAGCRGSVTIERRTGHALAAAHYALSAGQAKALTLRLRSRPAAGARLRVVARETDVHGRPKLTIATRRVRR